MRRISLLKCAPFCFKSFIEPAPIKLSVGPGFKCITGDNQAEPRLGANGAGKSSFLDAVYWCLYGQSLNGQRASALATWSADHRPRVVTTWRIDKELVEIERLGSPDKLLINGQPAEQPEVDRLMGLSRARFRHSVIFGQKQDFFAQLSIADRSALMEEICDLSIWQRASDKADEEAKAAEAEAAAADREILYNSARLEGLPKLADLRAKQAEWQRQHDEALADIEAEWQAATDELWRLDDALGKLEEDRDLSDLKRMVKAARARIGEAEAAERKTRTDYDAMERHIKVLGTDPRCPNCGQDWPAAHVRLKELNLSLPATHSAWKKAKIALARLQEEAEADEARLAEGQAAQDAIERERAKAMGANEAQKRLVGSLKKRRDALAAEGPEAIQKEIADRKAKRALFLTAIESAEADKLEAEGKAGEATYWKSAFRQVRLFQMRRVLAHLELEIEAAMNSLGLHGWRIALATETETKSGTFKQGVQIAVASPRANAPWESWSGGESQRLTLAITIGFANMIQRMSGVRYTFEFWDEPSAWLSAEGIDDMVDTLRDRAEEAQISLWLVDHRAMGAAFDETWCIVKDEGGSHVEKL